MGDTKITSLGFVLFCGFLAGCAWDNSPPPYHTVIRYDPSRAQTYVSAVPPGNAPSLSDWKTNQVVGVGYGSPGPSTPTTSGQAVGGATSTPSGVSSGGAAGISTPSPTPTPRSGSPGTVIGNPANTGSIGTYPTPAPTGPITTSPAISPPQPAAGVNPFSAGPSPQPPGFSTPAITNTRSGVLFTNKFAAPTNTFSSPGLNVPRP